jgi:hypothetical protein
MKRVIIAATCVLVLTTGCKNKKEMAPEDFTSSYAPEKELSEVKEILYSMVLPTDLSDLLERTGANFDPSLPAPISDIGMYQDPEQVAIMLGVYGVDLSYMKILEQTMMAAEYFNALKLLAGKAGLPESIFQNSTRILERSLGDQDSLSSAIEWIYRETDAYYRENGKHDQVALSLLGGWVEAMYIGSGIYASGHGPVSMGDKILQQKFSLNSVISVLSEHQESLLVSRCLLMLKRLKKEYDHVQIMYDKEGFSVDTTEKRILASQAHISYEHETLERINTLIRQIRQELIKTEA